jgi:hypothetical protein
MEKQNTPENIIVILNKVKTPNVIMGFKTVQEAIDYLKALIIIKDETYEKKQSRG